MNTRLKILASSLFLMLCSGEAIAGSLESWICLWNETSGRKLILVEDINNYDWDGVSRPDHNWNGTYVEAGRKRCERAEISLPSANRSFSFIIDGRLTAHKIEMLYDRGRDDGWITFVGADPSLSVLRGRRPHDFLVDAEKGKDCTVQGVRDHCYEFFIRDVP